MIYVILGDNMSYEAKEAIFSSIEKNFPQYVKNILLAGEQGVVDAMHNDPQDTCICVNLCNAGILTPERGRQLCGGMRTYKLTPKGKELTEKLKSERIEIPSK